MKKYDMSKLDELKPGTLSQLGSPGLYKDNKVRYFNPTALGMEIPDIFKGTEQDRVPEGEDRERFRDFLLSLAERGEITIKRYEGGIVVVGDFLEGDEIPKNFKYFLRSEYQKFVEGQESGSGSRDPMDQTSEELVVGRGIAGDPEGESGPAQPEAQKSDAVVDPKGRPTKYYKEHLQELGDRAPVNPDVVRKEKPASSTSYVKSAFDTWKEEIERLIPELPEDIGDWKNVREWVQNAIDDIGKYGDAGRKQAESQALLAEVRKVIRGQENRMGEILSQYQCDRFERHFGSGDSPEAGSKTPAEGSAPDDESAAHILSGMLEGESEGGEGFDDPVVSNILTGGQAAEPVAEASAEEDEDRPISGKLFDHTELKTLLSYAECESVDVDGIEAFVYKTREGSTDPMIMVEDVVGRLKNKSLINMVYVISDYDDAGNSSEMIPKSVFDRLLEIDEQIGEGLDMAGGKVYLSHISERWGVDMEMAARMLQERDIEVIGGETPYIEGKSFSALAEVDTNFRAVLANIDETDEAFQPPQIGLNYFRGMSPEDVEKRIRNRRVYLHNEIKKAIGQHAEPGEDIDPDERFEYQVNTDRNGKTFPAVITDRASGDVYEILIETDINKAVEHSLRAERFATQETIRTLEAMLEEASKKGADTASMKSMLVECFGAKPEDLEGRDIRDVIMSYKSDKGAVQALTRDKDRSRVFSSKSKIYRNRPDAVPPAPETVPTETASPAPEKPASEPVPNADEGEELLSCSEAAQFLGVSPDEVTEYLIGIKPVFVDTEDGIAYKKSDLSDKKNDIRTEREFQYLLGRGRNPAAAQGDTDAAPDGQPDVGGGILTEFFGDGLGPEVEGILDGWDEGEALVGEGEHSGEDVPEDDRTEETIIHDDPEGGNYDILTDMFGGETDEPVGTDEDEPVSTEGETIFDDGEDYIAELEDVEETPVEGEPGYSAFIGPHLNMRCLDVVGYANASGKDLKALKRTLSENGLQLYEHDDGNVVYCDITEVPETELDAMLQGQAHAVTQDDSRGNAMSPEQAHREGSRAISGIFRAFIQDPEASGAKVVLKRRAGEANYTQLTDEEKREAGDYAGRLNEALGEISAIAMALGTEGQSMISEQAEVKLSERNGRKRNARKGMSGFLERAASDQEYRSQMDQDIDLGNSVRTYISLDSILEELGYESLGEMIKAGKAQITEENEVDGREYNSDGYIMIEGSTFRFRRLKGSYKIVIFSEDVDRAARDAGFEIRYTQAEPEATAEVLERVNILAEALSMGDEQVQKEDVDQHAPEAGPEPGAAEAADSRSPEDILAEIVADAALELKPVEADPSAEPVADEPAPAEVPEAPATAGPAQLGGDAPLGDAVLGGGEPRQPYAAPSIIRVETPAEPAEAAPEPAPAPAADVPEPPAEPEPAPLPVHDAAPSDPEPAPSPAPDGEPETVPAAEPLVIEPGYADRVLPLTDEERAVYEALKRDYVRGFKDLFKDL